MMFKMKKKLTWVIAAVVVLGVGAAVKISISGGISAELFKLSKGDMQQYIEETAQVMPREKQTVYIEGAGKVISVNVDVGDAVKRGDILLNLDKSELELQLKDANAKIEASKAQLKGSELVNYANKIEMAKAALNQAQVVYDSASRNFENAKNLYESQALSKSEFDRAQDEYKAAKAALETGNLQLADLQQGTPDYVKSGYKSQLEQAVINRDAILRNLQKQEIRAEIDGVILEKLIDKNSLAAPAAAAFVIGSTNNLEVQADILADDINKIKIGNSVEISGKSVGDAVLNGKVVKIAPAAKTIASNLGINQKRVPVTIAITDNIGALKPGYNVDIKVITGIKNGIIRVPDSAVFDYKDKSHVFVVENGKAILREVKRGIESGNFIEIQEGLKETETILAKPDNTITEGAKIKLSNKKQ